MTEAEWLTATDPGPMLGFLRGKVSDRKLRLIAVACCRSVQANLWTEASKPAIDAAERFADGHVMDTGLAPARDAITAGLELYPGEPVYDPAYYACGTDLPGDVERCASYAAHLSTLPYPGPAADAQAEGVLASEHQRQCDFTRDIAPFRPVAFDPDWRTGTAVALASQMYDARDFGLMPLLADALEDAGCTDPGILEHCRGDGPHARGCWVVDLVLGKE